MAFEFKTTHWQDKKVILGETAFDSSRPVNILVGFHGADSTPENMLVHGNRLNLENTLMIFPEGPVDAGEGLWSWWMDGPKQPQTVKEFILFAEKIINQSHDYINGHISDAHIRTCLWGFSQGAAASLVYSLLGNHTLHKVGSVCGFLPELPEGAEPSSNATTILGIFGANDDVVPSFLAEYALDEMKTRGHELSAKETSQGHEINAENLQELSAFFAND